MARLAHCTKLVRSQDIDETGAGPNPGPATTYTEHIFGGSEMPHKTKSRARNQRYLQIAEGWIPRVR